jgi:hypothetical protein
MISDADGARVAAPVDGRTAKAATQARLQTLKKGVAAAAVVGFGVFSWLAMPQGAKPASSPAPAAPTAETPQQPQPGDQSQGGNFGQSDQSQGGFFGQGNQSQGGFFGQGGGGYGFGNGQGGPVAGSGVS